MDTSKPLDTQLNDGEEITIPRALALSIMDHLNAHRSCEVVDGDSDLYNDISKDVFTLRWILARQK